MDVDHRLGHTLQDGYPVSGSSRQTKNGKQAHAMTEQYDFDTPVDRRGTDSVKWDVRPGELPMTIADMDFRTAPEIVDALQKKVATGVFGYEWPGDDYFSAVSDWEASRHGWQAPKEWMVFTTGVVPALSSLVRHLSNPGDNVLVQTPVYNIFFNSIANNGRHPLANPLAYDPVSHTCSVDWEDLEEKLADPLTTLMILCNPHNPVGKVWEPEELARLVRLAEQHHVVIVSDEIHGDLVLRGEDTTPILSLPAPLRHNTIALVSPSKTFNLAALHAATMIVADEGLRQKAERGLNCDEVAEPNLVAIPGTIAAYRQGGPWLDALKNYLLGNVEYVEDFLAHNMPGIVPVRLGATYLMWLDCSAVLGKKVADEAAAADASYDADDHDALAVRPGASDAFASFIREKTGLIVTPGTAYHGDGGRFLRLAVACPRAQVEDAMGRFKKAYDLWTAAGQER